MNYEKLSKRLSYMLRHAPEKFGLELDESGWVDVNKVLLALSKDSALKFTSIRDIDKMLEISDKKRFEIVEDRIRALYGHSISKKILRESQEPPLILYHGTARYFMDSILKKGLIPSGRQYVHLSEDVETAILVGKRRDNNPVILKIKAGEAFNEGIKFYFGNDEIWLADPIPSKFIEVDN